MAQRLRAIANGTPEPTERRDGRAQRNPACRAGGVVVGAGRQRCCRDGGGSRCRDPRGSGRDARRPTHRQPGHGQWVGAHTHPSRADRRPRRARVEDPRARRCDHGDPGPRRVARACRRLRAVQPRLLPRARRQPRRCPIAPSSGAARAGRAAGVRADGRRSHRAARGDPRARSPERDAAPRDSFGGTLST